jgi:oligopeptide/dipeptide ABC transporter ATP-binding protein
VDDVSFTVQERETVGIVGESGCGKTTIGRAILRLIEPSAGKVVLDGTEVTALRKRELRQLRRDMQIVFQDPYASLDPRLSVGASVAEPLKAAGSVAADEIKRRVDGVFEAVGLGADAALRYPHEFSGGQRQRINIARALISEPRIIVSDEAVSALDVSVQAQVLNLMKDAQDQRGVANIFISHDLSVVRFMADRVLVVYLGRIVEAGSNHTIFSAPKHPYTRSLLSALPVPDPTIARHRIILQGEPPSAAAPPVGCAFASRCPLAIEACRRVRPPLKTLPDGSSVACHRVDDDGCLDGVEKLPVPNLSD